MRYQNIDGILKHRHLLLNEPIQVTITSKVNYYYYTDNM